MGVTAKTLHGARVCIIPRPENNYLPLALRRGPLAFASSLLVASKILVLLLIALLPSSAELSTITSERIIQLINAERKQAGLNELSSSPALSQAAQDKAKDMLAQDYFAHISPSGVTPWFWMQKYNYTYQVAGENLAIDFIQAEDVVAAWLASPSHKENIVHPDYIETGVAVLTGEYQGGTSTVVVHMFGLPAGASQPSLVASGQVKASTVPDQKSVAPVSALTVPVAVTAPPAPIVTTLSDATLLRDEVDIKIKAQPASKVTILINNQERSTVTISQTGEIIHKLALRGLPDGEIVIKSYAEKPSGIKSELSKPLIVQKDTVGPELNPEDLVFVISPATDEAMAAAYLPSNNFASVSVKSDNQLLATISSPVPRIISFPLDTPPIKIEVLDNVGNASSASNITLMPSFYGNPQETKSATPQRASQTAKQTAFIVATLLVILLCLAIFIRINIQHPRMIIQASVVLLLATALFLF